MWSITFTSLYLIPFHLVDKILSTVIQCKNILSENYKKYAYSICFYKEHLTFNYNVIQHLKINTN